jgi:predicted outer membrane repeat protein
MRQLQLFIVCLGLVCPVLVSADVIYVSGEVNGTWSADTVFVTGEIRVPPGDTLVIESGVEVLFQVCCEFTVDSTACIFAVGTETDSIRFDACIPGFSWHGISFSHASDSSRLEYCIVTDSDDSGIYCDYSNPQILHCRMQNCSASQGGGIKCIGSSPTIVGNVITGNTAVHGGGIYCHYNSSPTIVGNAISGNDGGSYGAAIYCYNESNPVISDNLINGNVVFSGSGGGISCEMSHPAITDNVFINNRAPGFYGGAIFCESSSPEISGNTFSGNSARGGGGIYCNMQSHPIIRRNVLHGNYTGDRDGGAICCSNGAYPTIINNTIVENSSSDEGGGVYCGNASNPALVNNILWDNAPEQVGTFPGANPTITYCDIQGGWQGVGNIDEDPLFVNPVLGDYHLQWGSPCIDAGDPNSPLDPDGTVADIGAFYYDQGAWVGDRWEVVRSSAFRLFPSYPNPFNPSTTLSFELPVAGRVNLSVYDMLGRQVTTLIDGPMDAGKHQVVFDGSGFASGVYFCLLQTSAHMLTLKMVLLK